MYIPESVIYVYAPQNAGVKFIANCIGLSDKSMLQRLDLINLSYTEKVNFLKSAYINEKQRYKWLDLDLGDWELFDQPDSERILSTTDRIAVQTLHTIDDVPDLNQHKIISMLNTDAFSKLHRPNRIAAIYEEHYQTFRNFDPAETDKLPKTFADLIREQPPSVIRNIDEHFEYLNEFVTEVLGTRNEKVKSKMLARNCDVFYTDTNAFNFPDTAADEIEKIYSFLGFDDFKRDVIMELQQLWVDAVETVDKREGIINNGNS